jgi:hypothetical protein
MMKKYGLLHRKRLTMMELVIIIFVWITFSFVSSQ